MPVAVAGEADGLTARDHSLNGTTDHHVPAWGKYEAPGSFHRLEHHCADVAACFEAMIEDDVLAARFAKGVRSRSGAG